MNIRYPIYEGVYRILTHYQQIASFSLPFRFSLLHRSMSLIYSKYLSMNRRLIILSQANIETHSRMRSSMILKDSVFRKEQRTHTISPERPTFLSLPCNPPQNQHRRINCMKARARFLFPIPYLLLPQHHVLPFSFHILEYFSKHTKDRKAAWNLNSHRTDNR